MGVGVKLELPSPGVQDGRDPRLDLGAEPLGIASQGRDGSGGGLEQDVEHDGWALAAKLAQIGRQREDQVKMWHPQNAIKAGLDPSGLGQGLALGAVAISTRVVGGPLESAGRAGIHMPAERGGPARHEVAQDRLPGQGQSVALPVAIEMSPKNVGQLEARTRASSAPIDIGTSGMHRARWSAEGLASGASDEVDRALHGAESHLAQNAGTARCCRGDGARAAPGRCECQRPDQADGSRGHDEGHVARCAW